MGLNFVFFEMLLSTQRIRTHIAETQSRADYTWNVKYFSSAPRCGKTLSGNGTGVELKKNEEWLIPHRSMHCVSSAINHEFINITSLKASPRERVCASVSLSARIIDAYAQKPFGCQRNRNEDEDSCFSNEWKMCNNVCNVWMLSLSRLSTNGFKWVNCTGTTIFHVKCRAYSEIISPSRMCQQPNEISTRDEMLK